MLRQTARSGITDLGLGEWKTGFFSSQRKLNARASLTASGTFSTRPGNGTLVTVLRGSDVAPGGKAEAKAAHQGSDFCKEQHLSRCVRHPE